MISKRFMSELLKLDKISLGRTEEYFLSLFLFYSNLSSYDILRELQWQTKLDEPRVVDAMAYKNVHKRIKRLQTLKLIRQLNREFPRKAKKYTLTNNGLFHLILSKYALNVAFYLSSSYINIKGNLINTILFQFFEETTIKEFFTLFRQRQLAEYLRNCCEEIQKKIEYLDLPNTKYNNQNLSTEFENLIKDEARKFVIKIVTTPDKDYENFLNSKIESADPSNRYLHPQIDGQDPNYNGLFPKASLNNDKRFLKLLKEIKDEFDKGCQDYRVSIDAIN